MDEGKVKAAENFFARVINRFDGIINRIGKTERRNGLRH